MRVVLVLVAVAIEVEAAGLEGLRCAIVGGGPAGLLLAHRLVRSGASVDVFEGRSDPRQDGIVPEGRAYALGLGLRGRTAIRSVDEPLWSAVAAEGFGSDRFTLHLPFAAFDLRKPDPKQEPSVLIYQTKLCGALLRELEDRFASSGRLALRFSTPVTRVDAMAGTVDGASYDLIAGCDGVQSVVRAAMQDASSGLEVEVEALAGSLKVVRLPSMPAALAEDAVHLVPGAGGLAAFFEPTAQGVCALISWRAPAEAEAAALSDDPAVLTDADEARRLLASAFPALADALNTSDVGRQFVSQRVSTASTVRVSTYHVGKAVLLGDSAHATGGATGQGCNSALQDSIVLADCLERSGACVAQALQAYSRDRVPEGHALLDLAVGPGRGSGPLRRAAFAVSTLVDTLLSKAGLGEPPLQTLLTTTLKPFSRIRRDRERLLGPFPSDADFAAGIDRAAADAAAPLPRDGEHHHISDRTLD